MEIENYMKIEKSMTENVERKRKRKLCAAGCGRRSLAEITQHSCGQCEETYRYCPDCSEELYRSLIEDEPW